MTSTEGVTLQVDDVYVPLGLVERKKQPKPQGEISPEQGSELYKETEITKTFEHGAFLKEVLKQQNTPKSKGRRIAIIGEPGAGKTTLLQQIANWVSREIPQSIVIWLSLADLQEQKLEEYLLGTWLTAAVRKKGKSEPTQQQKDDFVALFNQKNVWLLLDGLDEMSAASGNPLTEISRQFRESGFISQARIVLTCRVNLWDGGINALDNFDIYRTLDFSYPQQVEKFIHKWFAAIPEAGKQLCTALKEPGKERIQDLVKNPLRLTLLCFNWQSGDGKLPETQAGLYQRFVDDFCKWKKDEFPTTYRQEQQLNIKLGELAKTAIDKEATRFRLRQDFVTQFLGDAEDENSLFRLALNRGWLNQVGIDTNRKPVYAFFHASFQEYFAAKAIDDWHFFIPRNHKNKPVNNKKYRIFEPQWKQTILLWLGREEENIKQQKQQFIDALVNFKDGCGKWNRKDIDIDKGFYEYRAYFLAAVGIAEFREYSRADEIVAQIIKWGFGYLSKRQKWVTFIYPIQEKARATIQETERTKAIDGLVESITNINIDDDTKLSVVVSLSKIGSGNSKAIDGLVKLINNPQVDPFTQIQTAYSLCQIEPNNSTAITTLVNLIHNLQVDYAIHWQAAECLGLIDHDKKMAINILVKLIRDSQLSDDLKWEIAESLGLIDPGNTTAITTLVEIIGNPNEVGYTIQWQAAQSLKNIAFGIPTAMIGLSKLICDSQIDDETKWLVADSLNQIYPGSHTAIDTLIQLINDPKVDAEIQLRAAFSLGQIDIGKQIAITALVNLIGNSKIHDLTQVEAADSLGQIDIGNKMAITTLANLIRNPKVDSLSSFIKGQAAVRLGQIAFGSQIAIAALVQLTQNPHINFLTQVQAAFSLGLINPGNKIAISTLVQLLLSKDVDEDTRSDAAESLGGILQNNQHRFEVVKAVSGYLQLNNNRYSVLWKCAQNMPYPDFYQAWHQHNFATRTMRSLKQILFTRII
ncbi:NACHT domain-containing protein [Anabaena sp. UHCC 0399]|uniref:NACHT domain-containing protein n=1 Tax=Anabaena sp. UHCC 0399 TaxID=3110238 RepID=UPI002B2090A5|nr:NACHT domain-containing protein [Anabaena sp. UHCC 0399]MEA5564063.1 NACHT domain-containing protein [Anabaena sp. UHCC 0399]